MQQHFDVFDKGDANFVNLSPVSFLERAGDVYGDVIAVVHGEVRRTWKQTHQRTCRLSQGLSDLGVVKGTTISVLSENCPELLELHFAIPAAGGVISTLNIRLEAESIAYILAHSDSQFVFVSEKMRPLLEKALSLSGALLRIIQIGGDDDDYSDLLLAEPVDRLSLPSDEWDAISLNYTSGTSGRPKGVIYHHRGAYLMALGTVAAWQISARPIYLSVVPMFHCNGWGHPWMLAIVGGTIVFSDTNHPEMLFDFMKRESVTHFGAAPVVLKMMAESEAVPAQPFEPRIKVMTAGAPPPPSVLEATDALGMDVMHVYGLTETYGHVSQCLPQETWAGLTPAETAERRSWQGVRFPMVEAIEVYDRQDGTKVPRDGQRQGEIAIRGNTVMKGYYKDPAATKEAFRNGYFWSGDGAVIHSDGYLQIRDRLKDVIISGGENVSSVEVEAVLYRHPAVVAAAVVAKPDDKWGEVPCAFVELCDDAEIDSEEIIAFCREQLPGFKTPKTVVFRDLPITSTGKIQKFHLRNLARKLDMQ